MYHQIQTHLESNEVMMHIECTHSQFERIANEVIDVYASQGLSVIFRDEGMYERLNVTAYLEFYYAIGKPTQSFSDILSRLDLKVLSKKKMSSLEPGALKRVFFARALCMGSKIILIEDPLEGIDSQSAALLVSVMEEVSSEGTIIMTASQSFRSVCLMPGQGYYIRNDELIPLFESLDASVVDSVTSRQSSMDRIDVRIDGKTIMVNIADIVFAESIDSVCNLYVKNSYIPTHYTLDELQTRLERWGFFRAHRSYIVNIQRITEVKQWTRNTYVISLEGSESLDVPLSKRRYAEFQNLLRSE